MNDDNYVNGLIETLGMIIPANSAFSHCHGQYRVNASNMNGVIRISVEPTEQAYDDTKVKELVSNYKRNMDRLDDCLFLEVLDEIKDHLDLKTFNELTEQDSYSEEDAEIVKSMINFTNLVVHEHIVNKIQDLEELRDEF